MSERRSDQRERLQRRRFHRTVRRALHRLPVNVKAMLTNVEIVVEDFPIGTSAEHSDGLFGLYEGTPLTERNSAYHLTLPDKITIFRKPLEETFPDELELIQQIQITVVHEISHHIGLDEAEIAALGLD